MSSKIQHISLFKFRDIMTNREQVNQFYVKIKQMNFCLYSLQIKFGDY